MVAPAEFVPVTVTGVVSVKLTLEFGVPAIGLTTSELIVLSPELFTLSIDVAVSEPKSTVSVVLTLRCCKHASKTLFTSIHVFSHALFPVQHKAEELEFLKLQAIINLPFTYI